MNEIEPPATAIPLLDLQAEVDELWDDLQRAVTRVLRSGRFVLGSEVEAFEAEVAAFLGVRHAIGLNSGTDALIIGLRALGVGPGDEVITTAFSFFATAEAIALVGATPVFVDIHPETFNLDPGQITEAITKRTRALLPVHLYGDPAAMGRTLEIARAHELVVLEDAAQAFGARYYGDAAGEAEPTDATLLGRRIGSLGDAAAFSFYPTKNLGAYGDAGLLVTNDDEVAALARKLRNHGSSRRYRHEMLGYNSRLDALQAAILRVKLHHVDRWNALRRELAARYDAALADVPGLSTPRPSRGHVYHQYTVRIGGGKREAVRRWLEQAGIDSSIFYPQPLSETPAVAPQPKQLEHSHRAADEVLSLPLHPYLAVADLQRVAAELRASLG